MFALRGMQCMVEVVTKVTIGMELFGNSFRQFKGKNIRDPFKVGEDIDAISRATITVTSASRAVRNSSRRIARALLTPPDK